MRKQIGIVLILLLMCGLMAQGLYGEEKKELSLKQAIFHALKNNLDLKIVMTTEAKAVKDVKIEKTLYIPQLQFDLGTNSTKRPPQGALDGVDESQITKNNRQNVDLTVIQNLPLGGNVTFVLNNNRQYSNQIWASPNPLLGSQGTLTLTQPLLKGFGLTVTNSGIYIAKNNLKISRHKLRQQVINLVFNVEQAYWNLVLAHQNMESARMALERSQNLLKQNKIKVRVGSAAPIEKLTSEAEVARNESALIQAEQTIQTNEENLKKILNMSKEHYSIVPSDTPTIKKMDVNHDKFLSEALVNRPDIQEARLNLENNGINLKVSKNQALPEVNLTAHFWAIGQGGQQYDFLSSPFLPGFNPDTDKIQVGESVSIWKSMDTVFGMDYKNYQIALQVKIPVLLTAEKATLAKSRIDYKAGVLALQNVENTIHSEVKQLIKELQTNVKLVDADKIALKLESQKLKAEEKRLEVGISTNFKVQEFQRDYVAAEAQALQSVINYNITIAKINQALGRTFDIYNINFEDFTSRKK